MMTFDIKKIRSDFPILDQQINGQPLIYLDNAATSQKPQVVIDRLVEYYTTINANIHRGVHHLSQKATDAYEKSRQTIQQHIGAAKSEDIIFTSGCTHGINLVANGFSEILKPKDEIIISTLEHHSNIVPWQMLCDRTGAVLRIIPINIDGQLDMESYQSLLCERTKLVSCNYISNALGIVNPIQEIIKKAHYVGAAVLIDGAQSSAHLKIDVNDLDVDFYVASGHKMGAPTGTGFLYGKTKWLERLTPYQGGGEMIAEVTFEKTTYAGLPHKFEAGTPNIGGQIALGTAIDYLNEVGFEHIESYEQKLLHYATEQLLEIDELEIYGKSPDKASVISFNLKNIHPYDVGAILDQMGIAVRTGHHCTQPIMDWYSIQGTVRASMAYYNTMEEIDQLIVGVRKAKKMLSL